MMGRLFAGAALAAMVAMPLAAQQSPGNGAKQREAPPPIEVQTVPPPSPRPAPPRRAATPPPPPVAEADYYRALYDQNCGKGSAPLANPRIPVKTVGFASQAGEPARLILCFDKEQFGYPVPITNVDMALVFMSYRPLAPFWPAAEARWGADMAALREEVRAIPLLDALAANPYTKLMNERVARAIAASRTAAAAGDHAAARQLVENEITRIAARKAANPDFTREDFEMSLLMLRIGNLDAQRQGPSAGADSLRALIEQHPLEEYRANTDINLAAMLAEAGRYDESLAIIGPLFAGFNPDPNDPKSYEIAGSVREFSWIMACALKGTGAADAAKPYATLVNAYRQQPVDEYLSATKSNAEIQLRMAKCMDDPAGYAAVLRRNPPGFLANSWLEFQEQARPIVGTRSFRPGVMRAMAQEVASDYRQLPESYTPALQAWAPVPGRAPEPAGE